MNNCTAGSEKVRQRNTSGVSQSESVRDAAIQAGVALFRVNT